MNRMQKHKAQNLPYAIAYNEKDDYGNICGVKFKYFRSEKKRRKWCGKLEKRPEFAGYCGRYDFEKGGL